MRDTSSKRFHLWERCRQVPQQPTHCSHTWLCCWSLSPTILWPLNLSLALHVRSLTPTISLITIFTTLEDSVGRTLNSYMVKSGNEFTFCSASAAWVRLEQYTPRVSISSVREAQLSLLWRKTSLPWRVRSSWHREIIFLNSVLSAWISSVTPRSLIYILAQELETTLHLFKLRDVIYKVVEVSSEAESSAILIFFLVVCAKTTTPLKI